MIIIFLNERLNPRHPNYDDGENEASEILYACAPGKDKGFRDLQKVVPELGTVDVIKRKVN